ncbi:hypothetical protein MP228_013133 [Amoeboaphelidium protococcarum]|nr:hypothetical protein MP228_013133 [Amoeboaphelidium protococcarum]
MKLSTAILILCVIQSLCIVLVQCGKDYYNILGVSRDAGKNEIKRAYKRLSIKYHPDKTPEKEREAAKEKFHEVSEAYEVLSDEEKRKLYDQFGEEGVKQQGQHGGFGGGFHDPFDLFRQFGFGGHGGGRGGGSQKKRGHDINMILPVNLKDLYLGKVIEVDVDKQQFCPQCQGSGAKSSDDVKDCHTCGGSGVKVIRRQLAPGMYQQMQTTCDVCGGKGKIIKSTCPRCQGAKVVRESEIVDVSIERGMKSGDVLSFDGMADEMPDHVPGAINFHIELQPHPVFSRKGDNLYCVHFITLSESLLGFEHNIEHLDGQSKLRLMREGITPDGFVDVMYDRGMPLYNDPTRYGKLFVEYKVIFPSDASFSKEDVRDITRIFGQVRSSSSSSAGGDNNHKGEHDRSDEL